MDVLVAIGALVPLVLLGSYCMLPHNLNFFFFCILHLYSNCSYNHYITAFWNVIKSSRRWKPEASVINISPGTYGKCPCLCCCRYIHKSNCNRNCEMWILGETNSSSFHLQLNSKCKSFVFFPIKKMYCAKKYDLNRSPFSVNQTIPASSFWSIPIFQFWCVISVLNILHNNIYSSPSILQPSILRPPLIIRPLDLVPKGNFLG